ncbi:hypothetical protein BN1013_02066 [Candidatus Rubidus massiliensis]|nr:hypothetical protein BN1013_02066 [Candidatus Rubidus massiliensis]
MSLVEKISEDLKEAMKSRNQVRLDTLRMLKSKILTADARGNLSDEDVVKLFKTYAGNLQEAIEQSEAVNRQEMVDKLKIELQIVQEYLPKALSREETKKIVEQAITQSGAKTKKDLGLVMKQIKAMGSSIDGKTAKEIADELLCS